MQSASFFDADLVRRYDRHGPRYTSYPTALQFHNGFDVAAYRRAALLSNAGRKRPLSIYVHAPFCAAPCFYCGCNKIITRDVRQGQEYLVRLKAEIGLQAELFERGRRVQQLHMGGGTPTFFSPDQLASIVDRLDESFTLESASRREFSIEIDPRTVRPETFPGLAMLGFNRASLGVQDFEPDVQRAINRRQSVEQVRECVDQARAAGFTSISFDLIYGLPLQNLSSFGRTLGHVVHMRPERIAVYGYAHLPKMFKPQRAIDAAQLPDAALRLQLVELTVGRLTEAGYVHIGMDHFALPGDELTQALHSGGLHRNFQGYSTRSECELIGLGVSSISSLGDAYAQNSKLLSQYYEAIDHGRLAIERGVSLTVDDRARRDVIQQIMCGGAVACREVGEKYALNFDEYFASEIEHLRAMQLHGLVDEVGERIVVSARGRFLLRSIAMVFDAYLRAAESDRRFSKVI